MKKKLFTIVAIAMSAAGCTAVPPLPSEEQRFKASVTQNICNVDALAEEKQTILTSWNDSKKSVARHQNKFGEYSESTQTLVDSKLYPYIAELEASYKFATQMCGAYSQCLSANHHQGGLCDQLLIEWRNAQTRFNEVATDIRNIDATVEIERLQVIHKKKPYKHIPKKRCCNDSHHCTDSCNGYHGDGYRGHECNDNCNHRGHNRRSNNTHHGHGYNGCCSSLNNIFTDCCR